MRWESAKITWTLLLTIGLTVGAASASAGSKPQAPSQEDKNARVLPFIAVGGLDEGWHFVTVLKLKNTRDLRMSGTLEFFGNDDRPLHVQLNNGSALVAQTEWTLPAKEARTIILSHSGGSVAGGWLRIRLGADSTVEVSGLVEFYNGDHLVGEANSSARPSDQPEGYPRASLPESHPSPNMAPYLASYLFSYLPPAEPARILCSRLSS